MAVTQYIGARYVPLFATPIDWSINSEYEPLTIVYNAGNSYTSRQSVPKGIDISDTKYWALTGNYNAQIEQYRREVAAYDGRITENAKKIADEVTRAVAEETEIKELIEAETARAKAAEEAETARAKAAEEAETARAKAAEEAAQTTADNALSLAQTNEQDIATLDSEMAGTADSGLKTLIDSNTASIAKAVPETKSEISSVPDTQTRLEYTNDKTNIVYDANYAANFNTICSNPLAILQATSGYRTATNIEYANDYTATNVNENYDDWEPARNHPTANGKYAIDCTTFAVLILEGILYSSSTYTTSGKNTAINRSLNMFSKAMKNYIGYESYVLGEEVAPEHRRILASELAHLLYDAGKLQYIGSEKIFFPGDFLFYSNINESRTEIWEHIGHCAIYVCHLGDKHVIIDSSKNRGGANDTVNYHILTDTELSQIKWKFTIPQYIYPLHNQYFNFARNATLTTSKATQTFSQAGCALIHNPTSANVIATIDYEFPDTLGTVSYSIALSSNNSHLAIVPPGVKLGITGSAEGLTVKYQIGGYGLLTEPYRP